MLASFAVEAHAERALAQTAPPAAPPAPLPPPAPAAPPAAEPAPPTDAAPAPLPRQRLANRSAGPGEARRACPRAPRQRPNRRPSRRPLRRLQEASPSLRGARSSTSLSDVVVTAQKREEKVQDVPTSITVASGKQLTEENITTANDVERLTPNLSGQQSSGRQSRARWFLRGVGTNDPSQPGEPDRRLPGRGLRRILLAQTFPLFDLERVGIPKVRRHALGARTTTGAIRFISRKPAFDASGYLKGTYGSYGLRGAEGGFGGPVIGDWPRSARVVLLRTTRRLGREPAQTDPRRSDYTDVAARLQLLANVTDDVEVLLQGRFRVLTGGTNAVYPTGVLPGGAIQQNPMNPDTYTPVYGTEPEIKDPFYGGAGGNKLQTVGATATVNWHIGDYTLTSISAIDHVTDEGQSYSYQPVLSFNQTASFAELDVASDQPGAPHRLPARGSAQLDRGLPLLQLEPLQQRRERDLRSEPRAEVLQQQPLPPERHQLRRVRQRHLRLHREARAHGGCSARTIASTWRSNA